MGINSEKIKINETDVKNKADFKVAVTNEYSILFVDDDKLLLDNFVLQFGRQYTVYVADSMYAAIRSFDRLSNIDVVISDMRMPGGSGLDLLSWVKKNHPRTSRILLTGHADLEIAIQSVNAINVFKLLTKPCSLDALGEAILEACLSHKIEAVRNELNTCGSQDLAMEEIIQSLNHLVEQRDSNTAEHHKRTATLCKAIATQMELREDRVKVLELAAMVHDVAKILIPMAYLNKSGKLCDLEQAVIRKHPESGYHMLIHIKQMKNIAIIVQQHHEREDGSGYPMGLIGKQMQLEAKILAVADTVDAMASHRPYRSSLGLDAAINELHINRGVLYDPQVVDAACKVLARRLQG
ncbi:HD domain-containing phosphohydrolase [Maridesulfovibrio ferrireducens]|uniref:HD domain-containing phosphohydrolase n=1 Tax=Maridesulfovibrio ferrireducens TaxID=246191 RepID=UPI001A33E33B|nr:HD domain-containing phosphohydrolase [Maridesulfovibrio ferrireducens]MBI9112633.1 response regulator [Maridesulfovibrio ferrireducens]